MKQTKFKKILALVLAVVMCLGLASTALADNAVTDPIKGETGETGKSSARAAITKIITFAPGETFPAQEFKFNFVAVPDDSASKDADSAPAADAATIPTQTISFVADDNNSKNIKVVDGLNQLARQTGNIFETLVDANGYVIPGATSFKHAGKYEYIVFEDQNVTTDANFTISKEQYRFYVYVANEVDTTTGVPTGKLFIKNIGVVVDKITTGGTPGTPGTPAAPKLDPTPGTPPTEGETSFDVTITEGDHDPSDVTFTNPYAKTGDGDPEKDDDQILEIEKKVTGAFADTTKHFDFAVTLTESPTAGDAITIYKGYIVSGTGANQTVVTAGDNLGTDAEIGNDTTYGDYIEFKVDANKNTVTVNVKLQGGQKLVFTEKGLVGATFAFTEAGAAGYTASGLTYTGGTGTTIAPAGTLNNGITVGETAIATPKEGNTSAIKNGAVITNACSDIPITGITMSNLPFIVLIALAVIALAVLVVVMSKKRKNNSANR